MYIQVHRKGRTKSTGLLRNLKMLFRCCIWALIDLVNSLSSSASNYEIDTQKYVCVSSIYLPWLGNMFHLSWPGKGSRHLLGESKSSSITAWGGPEVGGTTLY